MELVKDWQANTKEPENVPAAYRYKGIVYNYSSTQYQDVGSDKESCWKGIRIDFYTEENQGLYLVVVKLLNETRGYIIDSEESRTRIFDLKGNRRFKLVDEFPECLEG